MCENKHKHYFKIFHQNIFHLPSRIESLQITLAEINPDLVILCEHKMRNIELNRLHFPGYSIISSFSRSDSNGGGILILSKIGIKFKNININLINNLLAEKEFESYMVDLKVDSFHFALVGI